MQTKTAVATEERVRMEPSGEPQSVFPWPSLTQNQVALLFDVHGSGSIGASNLARHHVQSVVDMLQDLSSSAYLMEHADFLRQLESTELVVRRDGPRADAERIRPQVAPRLLAMLEHEPIEDGVSHAAEELLESALASVGAGTAESWLESVLADTDPSHTASIIRLLGRLERPLTSGWRRKLIKDALLRGIEVRDAAIQAVENWEAVELVELLESHTESESWLSDYILQVVADLNQESNG